MCLWGRNNRRDRNSRCQASCVGSNLEARESRGSLRPKGTDVLGNRKAVNNEKGVCTFYISQRPQVLGVSLGKCFHLRTVLKRGEAKADTSAHNPDCLTVSISFWFKTPVYLYIQLQTLILAHNCRALSRKYNCEAFRHT